MKHAGSLAVVALMLLLMLVPSGTARVVAEGTPKQIMIADADGTNQHSVTSVGNNFSPTWSPDNRKLAMTSDRDGGWDVYVHDFESGKEIRITATHDAAYASWFPNGKELIFSYSIGKLGIRNADGTGSIRVLQGLENIFFTQPVVSPNGQLIASYGETVNGGSRWVYIQKADGSNKPIALPAQGETDKNWQPAWKNNSQLTYVSMQRDGTRMVTYNVTSNYSTTGPLVNGLSGLSWNSKGDLAYSWYSNNNLVSVQPSEGEARLFAIGEEPIWSTDGRIAYVNGPSDPQSGWICPNSSDPIMDISAKGTDSFEIYVDLRDKIQRLLIKPDSNLKGASGEWENPQAGRYSRTFAVTDVFSSTVTVIVGSSWGGFNYEMPYQCGRLRHHIQFKGDQSEKVHLEGPDLDETISLTDGQGQRLWLADGVYQATPIISGVEQVELRKSIELIYKDGVADWTATEPQTPPTGGDTSGSGNSNPSGGTIVARVYIPGIVVASR